MQRAVLMGDPSHFSVKGGANPHTRNWLGLRRRVNRERRARGSGLRGQRIDARWEHPGRFGASDVPGPEAAEAGGMTWIRPLSSHKGPYRDGFVLECMTVKRTSSSNVTASPGPSVASSAARPRTRTASHPRGRRW